jgi:phosphatidylglycerophosphatase A
MMNPGLPSGLTRHPLHLLSLGLGLGAIPFAPGTFGTLLGVVLYLALQSLSLAWYLIAVAILFYIGVMACGFTARAVGADDPGVIVFDEVVGYLIAMAAAPRGWGWTTAGFVLFRLFDIWKPWPIRWSEHRIRGGLGIMFDDALAGVYTMVALEAATHLAR